jgi:hypothetical protein
MRRLFLLALVAASLAPAPRAHAACAAASRSLGGTIEGEDGRFLSTVVGVELFNSSRQPIGMDGCPAPGGQYGAVAKTNMQGGGDCCSRLDGNGAPASATGYTKSWRIDGIPDNAASAWIETYPHSYHAQPGDGSHVSYVRYGGAMRRYTPLATDLRLRLPLACGVTENGVTGNNGSLAGRITRNGSPVEVKSIIAWSRAPDGADTIMSFVLAEPQPAGGAFRVPQLEPGQAYTVLVTLKDGSTKWFENDYGDGVPVRACAESTLDLDVGTGAATVNGTPRGAAPAPATAPPPAPAAPARTPRPTRAPTPQPSAAPATPSATPGAPPPALEPLTPEPPSPEAAAPETPGPAVAGPPTGRGSRGAVFAAGSAAAVGLGLAGLGLAATLRRRRDQHR